MSGPANGANGHGAGGMGGRPTGGPLRKTGRRDR